MDNDNVGIGDIDEEIDLKKLFDVLWAGKYIVIGITFFFAVASVLYSLSIPNQYRATAVLAQSQSGDGGLSSALDRLDGLMSLTGVNIGASEGSESKIAQEIMKSWNFIEIFINKNNLAAEIYASEGWSKEFNDLEINQDIYDSESGTWLIQDSSGNYGPPSSWQLFKKFSSMLTIIEDRKGFVSVSLEFYSPILAKKWLDMYIKEINEYMQEREVLKVSNNIDYLEDQINKTVITEMREVFYTIIEEQTKNKMVAEASPDYVFVSVSPSMIPEEKSKPQRALICVLGTLFGGILSIFLVLITPHVRDYFRAI